MRYRTGGAFRQALEARLREQSIRNGVPLTRLRKTVAFDRFLARLVKGGPISWLIKGGFAMQLRLGDRARTTKDIDAATTKHVNPDRVPVSLRRAASIKLADWFTFEVSHPSPVATGAPHGGLRFPVQCRLDGRDFERFHLDVGLGDPVVGRPRKLNGPPLLAFAGIRPTRVPCYPLSVQIAEKVHAYTRSYAGGGSSRVRDLVDILLIASVAPLSRRRILSALHSTFQARATHDLPPAVPAPPANWAGAYKKMARELNLVWPNVAEAGKAGACFLNPVLQETGGPQWDPSRWTWSVQHQPK
jgi:hypothetical protein